VKNLQEANGLGETVGKPRFEFRFWRQMRRRDEGLLSVLLVTALAGCGGHSAPLNDGASGFTTRVDPKKALGTLDTSERTQLCKDIVSYTTSTLVPDACRRAALATTASAAQSDTSLTDADLQRSCASQDSACLASSVGTDAGAPGSDAAAVGSVRCDLSVLQPSCSATVAEYAACLTDLDAADKVLPSCEATTRAMLTDLASDGGFAVMRPTSCAPVDQCTSGDGGP
jgi:hypothetical protein